LAEAVEELDIPAGGDALVEAFALLDRLEAKVSEAVGAFDASEGYGVDGAASAQAWVRHFTKRAPREASACVRRARRLRSLPCTAAAWAEGSLSSGQVQAVVANVCDATVGQLAEVEADLVPLLSPLTVSETAVAMLHWRLQAEALVDPPEVADPSRSLHCSRTLDGRRELKGHLDAEGGEILEAALRQAASDDVVGEAFRSASERRADALVDLCRWYLDHYGETPSRRHRPHVNVVVDLEEVEHRATGSARVLDGPFLDAATIERILCDANVHRVVTDGRSSILDLGRSTRTIPAALWAALVIRDEHCRFPGCDRPSQWCEGHHVRFWSEGGETNLSNIFLGCTRHHHLVHQPGWHVKLLADATVVVATPDGRVLTSHPPRGLSPPALQLE
jgi:hypothetical protein